MPVQLRRFAPLLLYFLLCILLSSGALCEEISVAVTGDMMFGPDIGRIVDREGSLAPFSDTVDILRDADFTFGFLEGGISTRGEPIEDKEHTFRSKPSAARGLANAGFDVVSLATPHIMDYGEPGLLDTLEFLSWYGIKYAGAGKDLTEARKRRATQDALCQAILDDFEKEEKVNFAYTTYRIVK